MKNQNFQQLAFQKHDLVELNVMQLEGVDGGSSPLCVAAAASSNFCGALALGFVLGCISTLQ